MKKIKFNGMDVIGFNTGRQYSNHGQRIIAVQLAPKYDDFWEKEYSEILFEDIDRMISGKLSGLWGFTEDGIMKEYDKGDYECLSSLCSVLPKFNMKKIKKGLFDENKY